MERWEVVPEGEEVAFRFFRDEKLVLELRLEKPVAEALGRDFIKAALPQPKGQ